MESLVGLTSLLLSCVLQSLNHANFALEEYRKGAHILGCNVLVDRSQGNCKDFFFFIFFFFFSLRKKNIQPEQDFSVSFIFTSLGFPEFSPF